MKLTLVLGNLLGQAKSPWLMWLTWLTWLMWPVWPCKAVFEVTQLI